MHEWYADGVGPESLLLGASMTKSVLAHLVGRAVSAGALRLEDAVDRARARARGLRLRGCTVEHVLTMTTGTDWVEDHRDPTSPATRLLGCFAGAVATPARCSPRSGRRDRPGTRWEYNTADSQVLDWVRERRPARRTPRR